MKIFKTSIAKKCILAATVAASGMLAIAAPAQAEPTPASQPGATVTCTGSDFHCDPNRYGAVANTSFWTMAPGHNCTNYVSFRLIKDGMPRNITWLHNGGDWARDARRNGVLVNKVPTVGSVAQWLPNTGGVGGSGHVAYVESVTADSITIIEDNYSSGPLRVRVIHRGDVEWPSNFIHFATAKPEAVAPTTSKSVQSLIADYEQWNHIIISN